MKPLVSRQEFLKVVAGGVATAAGAERTFSQQTADVRTYVYKRAGRCEIKADVYGADDRVRKPAVMWIHGGALILGDRKGTSRLLQGLLLKSGFVVVSIDYRLAPETKLPGILEDVRDAWQWVRKKGPQLFRMDVNRIGVAGGSAGGYLTLMAGFCLTPRPRALASFWGYGDIAGPWYSRPDPFYSKQPAVSKEEAYGAVGRAAISEPPGKHNRGRFYLYCRQQGLWPKEVTGHDPDAEPRWFDRFCPVRNVSAQYPPTLLVHGTADTDVPYELSKMMAEKLAQAGVKHELLTVPGGGHGLAGVAPAEAARVYERASAFLQAHTA
jgi:acetyl esterase/lipase